VNDSVQFVGIFPRIFAAEPAGIILPIGISFFTFTPIA
jgi:D-alanyl-lipoteichoic acid acyltransferase DltB (MBOAT superfamily)